MICVPGPPEDGLTSTYGFGATVGRDARTSKSVAALTPKLAVATSSVSLPGSMALPSGHVAGRVKLRLPLPKRSLVPVA